jgi:hypothetical protein
MSVDYVTRCWSCGKVHTLTAGVVKAGSARLEPVPRPGDASFCIDCGAWGIFAPDLPDGLRQPTRKEIRQLKESPMCQMLLDAWRAHRQRH